MSSSMQAASGSRGAEAAGKQQSTVEAQRCRGSSRGGGSSNRGSSTEQQQQCRGSSTCSSACRAAASGGSSRCRGSSTGGGSSRCRGSSTGGGRSHAEAAAREAAHAEAAAQARQQARSKGRLEQRQYGSSDIVEAAADAETQQRQQRCAVAASLEGSSRMRVQQRMSRQQQTALASADGVAADTMQPGRRKASSRSRCRASRWRQQRCAGAASRRQQRMQRQQH